jgi:general stress protein 26
LAAFQTGQERRGVSHVGEGPNARTRRGRPHATPVSGVWIEGGFYFGTGTGSRKARNLAKNQHLVVHLESGDEVVILEGVAEEVADPASLDGASARSTG